MQPHTNYLVKIPSQIPNISSNKTILQIPNSIPSVKGETFLLQTDLSRSNTVAPKAYQIGRTNAKKTQPTS
jgi:hypothetical protein